MLLTTLAAAVIWSGLAPGQQDRQLAGIADGYQGAGLELAFSDPARSAEFNARHDFILAHARELHRALDHFYADKRHAGVPLSKAVRYCCAVAAKEPDAARWLEDLAAVPRLGARSGRIPQTLASLKDPSFVDGGRPIGGKRYIIYGDLERFYLHEFKVAPDGGLAFASTPQAIKVEGLPPNFDGLWAPTAYMQDGKLVLLYCAGNQTKDIMWPTFRLRRAVATTPGVFRDQGAIFPDLAPYGPGDQDFGVIDPVRWVAPSGKAYLSYTVVRYGVANKRYHEEAVHAREVDVHDPSRALGPDRVVYAGLPKTSDDGVAEASDVVTLGKRAYVFVSSRAGDKDQRVLVAPAPPDLGPLPAGALKPLLDPGGADWKAAAVGSTSAAAINGKAYMVFQGMDRAERFTLGWTSLDQ